MSKSSVPAALWERQTGILGGQKMEGEGQHWGGRAVPKTHVDAQVMQIPPKSRSFTTS